MAIYQLYFLLIMAFVYLVCSNETSPSNEFATNFVKLAFCHDSKLPQGLTWLQRGVDITRLNLFRRPDDSENDGFRKNVIAFTCSGKTWKHPLIGEIYDLPDQVDHIIAKPDSTGFLSFNYYQTGDEYKASMKSQIDVSGNLDYVFPFSRSSALYYAYKVFAQEKTIHEISYYVDACDVTLQSADELNLDPFFVKAVQKLSGLIATEHLSVFLEFFNTFGTHYFGRARYGGKIEQQIEINSKYSSKNSKEEINLNAGASIKNFVKFQNEPIGYNHMTSSFMENTKITFNTFGGGSSMLENEFSATNQPDKSNHSSSRSIKKLIESEWIQSVITSSRLMKGTLYPISDLIADPSTRAQVELAAKYY